MCKWWRGVVVVVAVCVLTGWRSPIAHYGEGWINENGKFAISASASDEGCPWQPGSPQPACISTFKANSSFYSVSVACQDPGPGAWLACGGVSANKPNCPEGVHQFQIITTVRGGTPTIQVNFDLTTCEDDGGGPW